MPKFRVEKEQEHEFDGMRDVDENQRQASDRIGKQGGDECFLVLDASSVVDNRLVHGVVVEAVEFDVIVEIELVDGIHTLIVNEKLLLVVYQIGDGVLVVKEVA
jgi:hypothetical protein